MPEGDCPTCPATGGEDHYHGCRARELPHGPLGVRPLCPSCGVNPVGVRRDGRPYAQCRACSRWETRRLPSLG